MNGKKFYMPCTIVLQLKRCNSGWQEQENKDRESGYKNTNFGGK